MRKEVVAKMIVVSNDSDGFSLTLEIGQRINLDRTVKIPANCSFFLLLFILRIVSLRGN